MRRACFTIVVLIAAGCAPTEPAASSPSPGVSPAESAAEAESPVMSESPSPSPAPDGNVELPEWRELWDFHDAAGTETKGG